MYDRFFFKASRISRLSVLEGASSISLGSFVTSEMHVNAFKLTLWLSYSIAWVNASCQFMFGDFHPLLPAGVYILLIYIHSFLLSSVYVACCLVGFVCVS